MSGKADEKHFLICPCFAATLLHCFNPGQGSGDGSTSNAQIISPLPLILFGWSVHNSFWTAVHLCCVWYLWLKPLSLERLRERKLESCTCDSLTHPCPLLFPPLALSIIGHVVMWLQHEASQGKYEKTTKKDNKTTAWTYRSQPIIFRINITCIYSLSGPAFENVSLTRVAQ